jgi:hypothetical protein
MNDMPGTKLPIVYDSYAGPRENGMPSLELGENGLKIRRYRAIKDHLFSDLADEAVLLSLRNGKYYGLNHVGVAIWSIIQQAVTLSEIESSLMKEYAVDEQTCRAAVSSFLENMIREELIDVLDE